MPKSINQRNVYFNHHFTCTVHHDTSNLEKKVKCWCMVYVAVCSTHHDAT